MPSALISSRKCMVNTERWVKEVSEWTPEPLGMRGRGRRCQPSMPAWRNGDQGGGAGRREVYSRSDISWISPLTCKRIRPLGMALAMKRQTGSAFGRVGMEDGPWRQLKAGCCSEEACQHSWRGMGLWLKPPLFWNLCSRFLFWLLGAFQLFTITQGLFLIYPRVDLLRNRLLRLCSSKRSLLVRLSHRGLELALLV